MKLKRAIVLSSFFLGCSFVANSHAAEGALVVSAAASLKDVFIEAEKIFEQEHPGTKISFNFSSSNQLANQIEQGAPVDVYASADMEHIKRLASKNLLADNSVLAQNKLAVIVSKSARIKIDSLADLSNKGVRLIMAAKQIPVAAYARQFLKNADQSGLYGADYSPRVLANVVSEEPDVRMVAMKVAMGEGDAGIVYVSDVTRDVKNKVKTIAIADQLNVVADYGIAIVKNNSHPDAAKAFYELLLSPKGKAILAKNGLLSAQSK